MGVEAPETCWATHKRQIINMWDCCIWLVNLFEFLINVPERFSAFIFGGNWRGIKFSYYFEVRLLMYIALSFKLKYFVFFIFYKSQVCQTACIFLKILFNWYLYCVDNVFSVSMEFCLIFKCNAYVKDLALMYCFTIFCSLGTKSRGSPYEIYVTWSEQDQSWKSKRTYTDWTGSKTVKFGTHL
jgi:hypothetical protein